MYYVKKIQYEESKKNVETNLYGSQYTSGILNTCIYERYL